MGAAVDTAKDGDSSVAAPRGTQPQKPALKLPQETKDCPCAVGRESEGLSQRRGNAEAPLGLSRDLLLSSPSAAGEDLMAPSSSSGKSLCQTKGPYLDSSDKLAVFGHASKSGVKESEGPPLPLEDKPEAKQGWVTAGRAPPLGKSCSSQAPGDCSLETHDTGSAGSFPESRLKSNANNRSQVHQHPEQLEYRVVATSLGQKEEEQQQQRVTEATVCAKNSKVSSTGEKVVLWTRYSCLNCIFVSSVWLQLSYHSVPFRFHFVLPFSYSFCPVPLNIPALCFLQPQSSRAAFLVL